MAALSEATTGVFDESFNKMFSEEFKILDIEPAAHIADESKEATAEGFGDMFIKVFDQP